MSPPPTLPWWNRLSVRLTAAIVLVSLATMTAFTAVLLKTQREHLIAQVVESAALLSDTVKRGTYVHMLEDRRIDVYRALETIGQGDGIEAARLFNKEGQITFSSRQGETGTFVDKRAESCYACHAEDEPIARLNVPSRSRIYASSGHRVLGMVTPIYNEPACSNAACHAHPAEKTVLGVVDIGMSLDRVDRDMARLERATLGLSALALSCLAGVVVLFARRYVGLPVSRLLEGTRRIASGDLRHEVTVETRDEIGQLAESFNEMERAIATARAQRLALLDSLEQQVEERTAALKQAHARLVQSEKLSSLGRLAASVAHEINNPLAGILTYAKLLIRTLDDTSVPEATRTVAVKQLKLVHRETERCTAIVRNLLDFARERPLTLADIDVNAVLEDALALVANQAKLQGITLEKDLAASRRAHADFGLLRQAFVNIIINACDAMAGGGRLRVATRDASDALETRVEIADTGTGIPPEMLSKILDPFFTTKEKGTGLGLSVVYGIVERHGGRLEIESTVGQGTVVHIGLPSVAAAPPEAGHAGPGASSRPADASAASSGR
jgi:two-component system NtrC family sensor kinase